MTKKINNYERERKMCKSDKLMCINETSSQSFEDVIAKQ